MIARNFKAKLEGLFIMNFASVSFPWVLFYNYFPLPLSPHLLPDSIFFSCAFENSFIVLVTCIVV